MAGFWDNFSSSFIGTMGVIQKFPTKTEREQAKAQTGLIGAQTELAKGEEARAAEAFPLTKEQTKAQIAGTQAQTSLVTQQAEEAKYKNSKEYRDAVVNGLNSEATRALSEAGFNDQRAAEIAHSLTPIQVNLANAKTESETNQANAQAKEFIATAAKTDQEAAILKTELDPKFIKARREKIEADTLDARGRAAANAADAAGKQAAIPAVRAGTDLALKQTYQKAKALAETYGTPFTETEEQFIARMNKTPSLLEGLTAPAEAVPTSGGDAGTAGATRSIPAIGGAQPDAAIPTVADQTSEASAEPEGAVTSVSDQAIPTQDTTPKTVGPLVRATEPTRGGKGNVVEAQAGTRKLPLNDKTRTMLEAASADTGLTVRVVSGAQPDKGPDRKGSHRHDVSVGAADLKLVDENGRVLNMNNAADAQRMGEFAAAAKKHGATGFGAHPGYMGAETMHIGFGTPAVWGVHGSGRGADFLENALSGTAQGAIPTTDTANAGGMGATRGMTIGDAYAAKVQESTPESRQKVIDDGKTAAREGFKFLYSMIGPQSAVPTQERQQQLKKLLAGQGGPNGQQLADMRKSVQASMPAGQKRTLEEMNILNLSLAYKFAMIDGDPKAAQAAAGGMLQAYRTKFNQFTTFAQMYAQQGKLDESAQLAAKAYAYIPDGKELIPSMDKDGNMVFKIKDSATGKIEKEQVLTPQQWFSTIMGVSSYDFDKQLMRMAGENPAYQDYAAQTSAVPEIQYQNNVPQRLGPTPLPDSALMAEGQEGQASQAMALAKANQSQRDDLNKQIAPPAVFDEGRRNEIETQISRLTANNEYQPEIENIKAATAPATGGSAANLNALITDTLRVNPNANIDTIIPTLSNIVSAAALGKDGKAYQIGNGDYEDTMKIKAPGSPVEINIPANYAYTIIQAADAATAKKTSDLGDKIKTSASNAYTNAMDAGKSRKAVETNLAKQPGLFPQGAAPGSAIPMLR